MDRRGTTKTDGADALPLQLVYKDRKQPESERPDHRHDGHELVYVYRGEGVFFIEGRFFEMAEGDLFLLPGGTLHRAIPDSTDPVTSSILFFDEAFLQTYGPPGEDFHPLGVFNQTGSGHTYRLPIPPGRRQEVELAIDRILQELDGRQAGYRFAVRLLLQELLLTVHRIRDAALPQPAQPLGGGIQPAGYPWLQDVFARIESDLAGNLTLAALSKQAAVSPGHFSRVFKQTTGMSLTGYVHRKRILKAKELLGRTVCNLEAVMEQCGIGTLTHFHRLFRKYAGVTPAAYRRSGAGNSETAGEES